eukprot:1762154-Pyramimonas_sp.AAC.1
MAGVTRPSRPAILRRGEDVRPCLNPVSSTDSPLPDIAMVWEVSRVAAVLVDQVFAHPGLVF